MTRVPKKPSPQSVPQTSFLEAGAARVDITPPVGCDLTGFLAREMPSIGLNDPLFARALALKNGRTSAIIISCDLLGLEAAFVACVRRAIESETGVPSANVLIACSHTHSGPASMYLQNCGDVSAGYMAELAGRLADAAREAWHRLQPVTMAAGKTSAPGAGVNRRVPGGPVDEDLDVVRFNDEDGNAVAAIVSFACHPIANGADFRSISADFPGFLTGRLEQETGATALFLNGACAQINPALYGSHTTEQRKSGIAEAAALGNSLADAALALWPDLRPRKRATLRVRSCELELLLQRVDEKSLAPILQEYAESAARNAAAPMDTPEHIQYKFARGMLDWAWETLDEIKHRRVRKSVTIEIQTLQIGDVIFVAVPGEFFVELGAKIKKNLAPQQAIIVGYANGNIGYIPTRAAYVEGGYEVMAYVYYGYPAAVAPSAGEKIVGTVSEMHPPKRKLK